jgi:hypothetical protein
MKHRTIVIALVTALLLFLIVWSFGSSAARSKPAENDSVEANESSPPVQGQGDEDVDADLGKWGSRSGIDREEYLRLRDEYNARKRGIEPGQPFDPSMRGRAIEQMERQEKNRKIESLVSGSLTPQIGASIGGAWTPIGPTTISNGQALSGGDTSVSGRVTAIVVDPTNASKVYLGTAQGGVWRSSNGGITWEAIFDNADSLAIGALALAPSDPTKLYVGTGEFNGCGDCFFGVGLYRIDTVDATPTLVGPINPSETIGNFTYQVFNGRGITKIVVDPTNSANIFVATGRGVGGSGASSLNIVGGVPSLGTRGLWRSTNGTSAAPTFQKLVVSIDNSPDTPSTGNVDTTDIVMEPGSPSNPANPNNLLVAVIGVAPTTGGIYRTTNALAGTPTFTQVYVAAAGVRVNLAINKVGSVVTAYAATSESASGTSCSSTTQAGAVRKQIDPFNISTTWSTKLLGGGGFCGTQCFYDIAIAVNPNDANEVYLGGNAHASCSDGMKKSTDGATFTRDDNGLHADSHALFYDAAGTTIFTGDDGGVWNRASNSAAGAAWTNLNNAPLNTLQFESIAVHPTDRNLMIGGTQDNGTEYQQGSVGNWSNAEGGDGGYALIDQSATDTTKVTMYHTFFNEKGTQIGFDRALDTTCLPVKNYWPTRGVGFGNSNDLSVPCAADGAALYIQNGLSLTDNVLFYAPMALGPGSPNTFYFGTDRLYRSTDRGDTMTLVSQGSLSSLGSAGSPVSTIAIWPGSDNVRMVGLQNGQVWATSTGSSTLVNITGSFPSNPNLTTNQFVGRAVIDPNNSNVAYVAFSFFAPAGQGIWKITNLVAASGAAPATPVWAAAGNGIPSIPINGLVIDPINSNNIYAGTDIGVYVSTDGGANWNPFGTGLPRSAVFDLEIQPSNRILRAGTHGRGVWEISLGAGATLTNQTITFGVLSNQTFPVSPFAVSATASSGLAVSFTIFSGPATISGNTITITGVGTVVVRASQSGNASFNAAPNVDQSFTVAPPSLLTNQGTNQVVALDSVTFVSGPFSKTGLHNFSSDQITRVMLFTSDLGLGPSDNLSGVLSVQVQGVSLVIERVDLVPGLSGISYIIVRLDGAPTGTGLPLTFTVRGVTSNTATIDIGP